MSTEQRRFGAELNLSNEFVIDEKVLTRLLWQLFEAYRPQARRVESLAALRFNERMKWPRGSLAQFTLKPLLRAARAQD